MAVLYLSNDDYSLIKYYSLMKYSYSLVFLSIHQNSKSYPKFNGFHLDKVQPTQTFDWVIPCT